MDDKQITEPNFEVYFVNDSNYFMRFVILSTEGNSCTVWHEDMVEPNTKLFLREIGRQDINSLDRLGVQLIAFKRDQPFTRKPAVDVTLRIDPVKFSRSILLRIPISLSIPFCFIPLWKMMYLCVLLLLMPRR